MRVLKYLFAFLIVFFMITPMVFASSPINIGFVFCRDGVLTAFKLVNICITLIKIVVPLLLIIFGSIDFGKAIVSNDDNAIKKSFNILVKRAIAGIIIFFIPTILKFVFGLVYDIDDPDTLNDLQKCTSCLLDINNCK